MAFLWFVEAYQHFAAERVHYFQLFSQTPGTWEHGSVPQTNLKWEGTPWYAMPGRWSPSVSSYTDPTWQTKQSRNDLFWFLSDLQRHADLPIILHLRESDVVVASHLIKSHTQPPSPCGSDTKWQKMTSFRCPTFPLQLTCRKYWDTWS